MTPSSSSTVPPSPSSRSSIKRGQPDVVQAFRTFLRNAANYPSPVPPDTFGIYSLYLSPLVLRQVSPEMYQRAKIQRMLISDAGGRLAEFARKSRFNYFANLSTIMISLSNRENNIAPSFLREIRDDMCKSLCHLPYRYGNGGESIQLLGGSLVVLEYGGAISKFEPDAGLAWRGFHYPFLVCEVANNENSYHVLEKKRPYLLGSRGLIRFFIVITVERANTHPRKHLLAGGGALESPKAAKAPRMGETGTTKDGGEKWDGGVGGGLGKVQQDSRSLEFGFLQDEPDRVRGQPKGNIIKASISVYTSKVKPSDAGVPTRAVEAITESLEFWPTMPTGTLTIFWDDLGVKNAPKELGMTEMNISYSYISARIANIVVEEENSLRVDKMQSEVDGDNVGIELSSPGIVLDDDDE